MADLLDTLAWLWGDTLLQHVVFVFCALVLIGALGAGWTQADNAIRLNRRLRREDRQSDK